MKEKAVKARGVPHAGHQAKRVWCGQGGAPYALLLPSTDRKML